MVIPDDEQYLLCALTRSCLEEILRLRVLRFATKMFYSHACNGFLEFVASLREFETKALHQEGINSSV